MNLFSGVKIIDLTQVFSGPFATRHFSDFGAEVLKVEPPNGDASRNFPPLIDNWSGYFEVLNRNKNSLVLNLKDKIDLEIFYNLCKNADVVVENFTPDVKRRLKIDYEIIKQFNPKIIYASVSGISPNINKKYYDVIAQGESGLMSLNGVNEDMKVATSIVDAFSGMKLAFGISSALYKREVTGKGLELFVSMKGAAFDLLEQNLIQASIEKKNPEKVGNMDNAIAPFGIFKAKDGSIVLAIGSDLQWVTFSKFLLREDPSFNIELFKTNVLRLENLNKLQESIENIFAKYNSKDILDILANLSIPSSAVKSMLDVIDDEENYSEKLIEKVKDDEVGEFVTSTGGIFFSGFEKEEYKRSPKLDEIRKSNEVL